MHSDTDEAAILALKRPHKDLLTYYLLASFVIPPIFPILMVIGAVKYHTMRYKLTDEGISMSWGIMFRREIIIQYSRIQDIHLRSNVVERWLGLARVLVQTASGSAGAEMTIEGVKEFEAVRDFLYSRMRGVKDQPRVKQAGGEAGDELAVVLREVAGELREIRVQLANREGRHD